MSLVELLAYVGDVLSAEQDRIADEGSFETSYRREDALVAIRLANDLRPGGFIVADESRAFVVVIGSETRDSSVRFGGNERGPRPPPG